MADDKLKGITVQKGPDNVEPDEVNVDDLLKDLTVKDLKDFSPEQLDAIFSAIDGDADIEGITVEQEDKRTVQRRETSLQATQQVRQRESTLEQELDELEEIADNTDLLKRIAANTATIATQLEDNQALLSDIITALGREPALIVKDAGHVEFSRANNAVDVVKDSDITTSIVIIKASPSNNEDLYVGEEGVQTGNGFAIDAGEREILQVDALVQPFQIVAQNSSDTYTYIALGEDI